MYCYKAKHNVIDFAQNRIQNNNAKPTNLPRTKIAYNLKTNCYCFGKLNLMYIEGLAKSFGFYSNEIYQWIILQTAGFDFIHNF